MRGAERGSGPELQRRPEVTLTSSSVLLRDEEPLARRSLPPWRRRAALLVLPVVALALGLATSSPPPPAAPAPFDVELALLTERVSLSQSGVLVLPVELRNGGTALRVARAAAYASPVVDDPVVHAPQDVDGGDRRRFVALVAPDCRLLGPDPSLAFSAALLLRVEQGPVSRDVVLDLVRGGAVREVVAGLCAGWSATGPRSPAAA